MIRLTQNPALRAELEAALAIPNVQIRGLHDLAAVSISPSCWRRLTSKS